MRKWLTVLRMRQHPLHVYTLHVIAAVKEATLAPGQNVCVAVPDGAARVVVSKYYHSF